MPFAVANSQLPSLRLPAQTDPGQFAFQFVEVDELKARLSVAADREGFAIQCEGDKRIA